MKHRKEILAIAVPAIISNITTPLLGLVDVAITGRIGAAVYIGAIAVGGTMFNMLYWLFGFLRMGSSGLTAQAYGASDARGQALVLWRALLVGALAGMVMIGLSQPLCSVVLGFMDADGATASLAASYFRICIWGAPAVMCTYALSGWFLGMQDSRMLMVTSIVINVVNIAVSLAFVYGLGWQIEGVACGTLVAQWTGFATGLWLLRRYRVGRPDWRQTARGSELRRFFKVNADMMLRTACLIAVTVWFTKTGASQGAVILAVNTLLMQLFLLFSYMMDGFAFAGEALAGRYVGARDFASLHRCVRRLFVWGGIWAILFTALYFFGGEGFLGLLSSDSDVIAASRDYYLWAVSVPLAGFAAFAWDGVFIGATLTRQLLLSMAAAMAAFFILYFSLFNIMGNHALWLAFTVYLFLRGFIQTILYYRHKWN